MNETATSQLFVHTGIDFSIQITATLFGALIGFALALKQDRKKKAEDKHDAILHIIEGIEEELDDIIKVTTEERAKFEEIMKWDSQKHGFAGKKFLITTPAFESAVNSGDFILLPTKLQSEISGIYNRIYDCRDSMQAIAKFYTTPAFTTSMAEHMAGNLRTNLFDNLEQLKKDYAEFLPIFQKNKNIFMGKTDESLQV